MYSNLFQMSERCPECGLKFERAPGYFLGSTYINYAVVVLTVIPLYMVLHYAVGYSNEVLTLPLVAYCTIVPIILHRYARAWWLAMDCYHDPVGFGLLSGRVQQQIPARPARTESKSGSEIAT